jgi:hypothetical protein
MMLRCCLLLILLSRVWAEYSVFDQVQLLQPTWLYIPGHYDVPIIYRVVYVNEKKACVELHNRGNNEHTITARLAEYQSDPAPFTVTIPAGNFRQIIIPLHYFGRGCYRAPLHLVPSGDLAVPAQSVSEPVTASTLAHFVRIPQISAQVRADALAYTIALRDGVIDIHVRNLSHDIVHGDLHVIGLHELVGQPLPRVHILPGTTLEMHLPVAENAHAPGRITDAIIEITRVRFGLRDDGPLFIERADGDPLQFPFGDYPVAVIGTASTSARYNPWALSYRVDNNAVIVTNYTDSLISGQFHLRTAEQSLVIAGEIPAHGTHTFNALSDVKSRPFVGISDPQINQQPLPPPEKLATFAALPAQALPVMLAVDDARFNPLTLMTTIERADHQQARVTFYNIGGLPLTAQWKILGYTNANHALPLLEAGQALSITVPVDKSDIRLVVARISMSHIQLGDQVLAVPAP